jgi:hypothetical protein
MPLWSSSASPEADPSLRPHLPLQRGPSWRGSFERKGETWRDMKVDASQLAP